MPHPTLPNWGGLSSKGLSRIVDITLYRYIVRTTHGEYFEIFEKSSASICVKIASE